jgi:hypothetical protein
MQNENPLYIINQTTKAELTISTEVRGQGIINSKFDLESNPEICKAIIDLISGQGKVQPHMLDTLIKLGLLAKTQQIPNSIIFKCTLDNSLVPLETLQNLDLKNIAADYILNKSIYPVKNELPEKLEGHILYNECFSQEKPVLWIKDSKTHILMPFHLSETEMAVVLKLIQNKISIAELPAPLAKQLILAGILIPVNHKTIEKEFYNNARTSLLSDDFTVLPDVINPLQISALRNYYRELEKTGLIRKDPLIENRNSMHNEPTTRFIHHQLQYLVDRIIPESVKPSYTFLSIYNQGAILNRHTDREQCAWNISLVLDMEPELHKDKAWPIFLDVKGKVHEIRLGMGDAIIYPGRKVPHWRTQLTDQQKITVCFLHYVSEEFSGSLI